MFTLLFLAVTNIMKYKLKIDTDFYNGGYHHSFYNKNIQVEENNTIINDLFLQEQEYHILNKIQINYKKRIYWIIY